jgi:cystathionine gamma-synthase
MSQNKGRGENWQVQTQAIHAGRGVDPTSGAVVPPIHLSTTYERAADGSYPQGFVYTRSDNPNRRSLETCLARLEGGAAAAAFSSGLAATQAVLQTLAPGDHVIAPLDLYHGTRHLLTQVMGPWGLSVSFVDMENLGAVAAAVQPNTQLLWVETPSNPLLKLTDIAAVSAIAHQANARCACDSTWCTPVVQRPLALGADWVIHSTTKYLGGHSDLLGGVAIAAQADATFERLRQIQSLGGAVPSPFDCWLLLRGIQTLPYRMAGHCANALTLAQWLETHPAVEAVHYPGLPSHPAHALACKQMSGFGGMMSVQIRGGQAAAFAVAAKVQLFTRATSLGGVESLLEHRASIEGPDTATPDNLLRLSIGLEHVEDLKQDLAQALG